jgi:hypothetical protein
MLTADVRQHKLTLTSEGGAGHREVEAIPRPLTRDGGTGTHTRTGEATTPLAPRVTVNRRG